MSDAIRALLPHVKFGGLRFWGQWFGAPHDNVHHLVHAEAEGDLLRLSFHHNERLLVWRPTGVVMGAEVFRISDADRVRCEWYSYGRPETPENRRFHEYVKYEGRVSGTTDAVYRERKRDLKPNLSSPAVEIV